MGEFTGSCHSTDIQPDHFRFHLFSGAIKWMNGRIFSRSLPRTTLILQRRSLSTTSAPMPRLPPVTTAVRPRCSNKSKSECKIQTKAIQLTAIWKKTKTAAAIVDQSAPVFQNSNYRLDCICSANSLRSNRAGRHTGTVLRTSALTNFLETLWSIESSRKSRPTVRLRQKQTLWW